MKALFDQTSFKCSKLVTHAYSTSFSLGIRLFSPTIRPEIYAIYGFVRFADEIVDTFHDQNQEALLNEFEEQYHQALERRFSMNPILNSFQKVVHEYEIYEYVEAFMKSMRADLDKSIYKSVKELKEYIYGSAEVVGLMCLKVFVNNDIEKFEHLKPAAIRLGSAFQKVNFIRDLKDDLNELGRSYFPELAGNQLTDAVKKCIIEDIEKDFEIAYKGLIQLPMESRLGVFVAYKYYYNLLKKIKASQPEVILENRIRISNPIKLYILTKAYIRLKFNII
ncbi:phytoene/squalene synthase family protein [Robertkochia solimangrovi]|uniref:phytoene/squalene synthase family protein n=1 Tax=Robertkochia solimangrovi TaxID=2213046 RepID=UPI00117D756F|nr:phytoene/squalene synthase family protein [Robertkochia solimangrovi]TRZ42265.1 phytoene/squalene synthase family protein [Robertkochia solimangrovi]